jgi:hypothetical protein
LQLKFPPWGGQGGVQRNNLFPTLVYAEQIARQKIVEVRLKDLRIQIAKWFEQII